MGVRISAVIITLNEERNIGRCLDSLKGVADEIVVVDSYSSDRTEEICRAHHTVFIRHRFAGYIEQVNWAILQASSPYVLCLDADEALTERLKASILQVKDSWTRNGYYFNRLTSFCGKWIRHTSWYPARKMRLFDSRMGSFEGVNPHYKFQMDRGASWGFLRGDLLHYSYYTVDERLKQMASFSSIMARAYSEQGRRAGFYNLTFRPFWRFMRDFILLRGFLDGYFGFVVSMISAHEVFLKYVKLREIYRNEEKAGKKTLCFFNSHESWGGGEQWHYDIMSAMIRRQQKVIYISARKSPLSRKLISLHVTGYHMMVNNLSFLNPFKILKITRIFRQEKVGVLVTNLSCDMKVASLAGRLAGVPNIIYLRGTAIPVRDSLLNRYLFRKVLSHVVANSEETKRTILARNPDLLPGSKIRVIYNGVYLPRYHTDIEPLYKAREGEILLGSAGRLSEKKGHLFLLEMMKELQADQTSYRLLIAGEGGMLRTLERKAKKLGVRDQVEFLRFVEDMPAFFSSIDIFLLPSRFEGFGYVLAEAMACRKPVVVFDFKSSPEIVEDGVTGYITRSDRVDEMTRRVRELAGDRKLREEIGAHGRARVEALFSFEKNFDSVAELLRDHQN
jgi:glycosyltransferase involved in cell wall biosynthesis